MDNFKGVVRRMLALLGLLMLTTHWSFAETVDLKLKNGVIANADFLAGKSQRTAILLLHGFLQTGHTLPISALAGTLSDQGYTVLVPTLSLGINRRARSLACEAVHMHTKEGDVAEIGLWVNWLIRKGYQNIVLVGHSSGSLEMLQYLTLNPAPEIRKAILISLIPLRSIPQDVQNALARIKQGAEGASALSRYTLGYCNNNYVSPPAAYLSYAEYDSSRTLAQFGKARVPVEVIMGSADSAMAPDWPDKIRARGIPVAVIDKATHFFDGMQEFDLADKVASILTNMPEMSSGL
jgi:pimeloyl-ACP methyl ester carboxylesterase